MQLYFLAILENLNFLEMLIEIILIKYDFNIWNRAVKVSFLLNLKPSIGSLITD